MTAIILIIYVAFITLYTQISSGNGGKVDSNLREMLFFLLPLTSNKFHLYSVWVFFGKVS